MRATPVPQKASTGLDQLLESNTYGLLEQDWKTEVCLRQCSLKPSVFTLPPLSPVSKLQATTMANSMARLYCFLRPFTVFSSGQDRRNMHGDFSAQFVCRHGSANWFWTFKSMSNAENSKTCFLIPSVTTKEMEFKLDCQLWKPWQSSAGTDITTKENSNIEEQVDKEHNYRKDRRKTAP